LRVSGIGRGFGSRRHREELHRGRACPGPYKVWFWREVVSQSDVSGACQGLRLAS
jgi:hypothetical protein